MNWIEEKLAERKYAERPIKPFSPKDHSADGFIAYGQRLKIYEAEMDEYRLRKAECDAHNLAIEQEIEARIKEDSGLNSIPEQYRDKVWRYAWDQGHSAGYHEVQNHLVNLVGIFL